MKNNICLSCIVVASLTISIKCLAQSADWQQGFLHSVSNDFMNYYALTPHWVDGAALRKQGDPNQPAGEIKETNAYRGMITLGVASTHHYDLGNLPNVALTLYQGSNYFSLSIDDALVLSSLNAHPDHHLSLGGKLYNARFVSFSMNKDQWTLTMVFAEKGTQAVKPARLVEITRPFDTPGEPISYQSLKEALGTSG
ncbi:hypothetical protein [Gilvimarinus algae]|uniref:Uncharacterized protein n=1 Tax=Gilvimarinus algae TaxID=3058037 RepID=A0ABT8TA08_9GAMM|nr:hypothetical protein [Gilvimarinus sp. SDUM040014]MDO3380959.1 hypothetical protein [Gilvimarinus sp. SDUM040014]